jgi:hypothetical protein
VDSAEHADDSAEHPDGADEPGLRWNTRANPNTADGEVQAVSAFARAAVNATGWRRIAARLGALLALLFIGAYLIAALVVASR